jgi:hypothetical protein
MFTPYNKDTASIEDRIAWALCQIIDDDAPMRWTRYRAAARCIAMNHEVMDDLNALAASCKRANSPIELRTKDEGGTK